MINLKKDKYLQIIFILSLIVLAFACSIQYILGYQPCSLCIIERIPYVLAIIILILNYKIKENQIFFSVLLMLVFSFSILISLYHFGIEQNFISESTICKSDNINITTKEEILKSFEELRISCKNVAFKILGLSLTTYNIFLSLFMFLLSTKIYLLSNDIKK